eukprot:760816-Hanusia_phi.AAC.3
MVLTTVCRQWSVFAEKAEKESNTAAKQKGHDSSARDAFQSEDSKEDSYFLVNLFVAALGDGKVLSEGARKKQDLLEQVVRNVSKEQNTVVHVSSEASTMHIKLRVFVENSIEAKAVTEYIASHPNQIHMAVKYNSKELDISCASVADRLRKQAKTRAVKILKEAIADPSCGATFRALRGYSGPSAPSLSFGKYIHCRTSVLGAEGSKRYIVFSAKNKCGVENKMPSNSLPPKKQSSTGDSMLSAFFPVNLFVTAIGDGALAKDISPKARERLEMVLSKIPKEQHTCVEIQGEGVADIKMRVFVANSEDAKAVSDYIQTHEKQLPAPFVVLARDIPMALLYDPSKLDLADSSVADRLRKQAKTRAVKLVREIIADEGRGLNIRSIRGHQGPYDPASVLEQLIKNKATPLRGHGTSKRYITFSARNKSLAALGSIARCSLPQLYSWPGSLLPPQVRGHLQASSVAMGSNRVKEEEEVAAAQLLTHVAMAYACMDVKEEKLTGMVPAVPAKRSLEGDYDFWPKNKMPRKG